MFRTLYRLIFNRQLCIDNDSYMNNGDVIVITPLKENPPYVGYLSIWWLKSYTVCLLNSWRITISDMKVGNIFKSIGLMIQLIIGSAHIVNYNIDYLRSNILEAYYELCKLNS